VTPARDSQQISDDVEVVVVVVWPGSQASNWQYTTTTRPYSTSGEASHCTVAL